MTTTTQVMQPMIGEPAPVFDLVDPKGQPWSLEGQLGKFVVIHFGTSW